MTAKHTQLEKELLKALEFISEKSWITKDTNKSMHLNMIRSKAKEAIAKVNV